MKKSFRLARPSDFARVMSQRRVHAGRLLIAFAVPRDSQPSRIGITTSRRLRPAARRNRARRRLREVAREVLLGDDSPLSEAGIPYDVVLVGRESVDGASFAELRSETAAVLRAIVN